MVSLFNWSLASTIAWFFADDFNLLVSSSISDPKLQLAASFAILLLIALIACGLVLFLMLYDKNKSRFSIINHIVGIPFAFLRGLLWVNLVLILAGLTSLPQESWWQKSKVIPPFQASAIWLKTHFPSGFSSHIRYH